MDRRAFLKTATTVAAGLSFSRSGWAAPGAAPADRDILAQASERIEAHRKGDGLIAVRSADGKPLAGAIVRLEQVRHEFLFGCNFFNFARAGDPESERDYRQRFAALLNYATLGFYWAMYEPERGRPGYQYTEQAADWCRDHDITCKGHPLVWDNPASSPRWLPEDASEIERLSVGRVREIVGRFQGKIDLWDVVNEATHLGNANQETRMSKWATPMGSPAFVSLHLKAARAANPGATLLVNDYRVDPPYYRLLDALRVDGKLEFDVVGIQSHMHSGPWPVRKVWDICETYAKLGRPLHFTETTVVSSSRTGRGEPWGPTTPELEAKQAERVGQFYTILFSHPAVSAVTWWDFSDRRAWQGAAAGLLRKDMSPKPAYEKLASLIKGEWWTRAQGRTNDRGEWGTRAFFGTYQVKVEFPDGRVKTQAVRWQKSATNRIEIVAS